MVAVQGSYTCPFLRTQESSLLTLSAMLQHTANLSVANEQSWGGNLDDLEIFIEWAEGAIRTAHPQAGAVLDTGGCLDRDGKAITSDALSKVVQRDMWTFLRNRITDTATLDALKTKEVSGNGSAAITYLKEKLKATELDVAQSVRQRLEALVRRGIQGPTEAHFDEFKKTYDSLVAQLSPQYRKPDALHAQDFVSAMPESLASAVLTLQAARPDALATLASAQKELKSLCRQKTNLDDMAAARQLNSALASLSPTECSAALAALKSGDTEALAAAAGKPFKPFKKPAWSSPTAWKAGMTKCPCGKPGKKGGGPGEYLYADCADGPNAHKPIFKKKEPAVAAAAITTDATIMSALSNGGAGDFTVACSACEDGCAAVDFRPLAAVPEDIPRAKSPPLIVIGAPRPAPLAGARAGSILRFLAVVAVAFSVGCGAAGLGGDGYALAAISNSSVSLTKSEIRSEIEVPTSDVTTGARTDFLPRSFRLRPRSDLLLFAAPPGRDAHCVLAHAALYMAKFVGAQAARLGARVAPYLAAVLSCIAHVYSLFASGTSLSFPAAVAAPRTQARSSSGRRLHQSSLRSLTSPLTRRAPTPSSSARTSRSWARCSTWPLALGPTSPTPSRCSAVL